MPENKPFPQLTISNKLYFRDDGLYIYSSADGRLDIIADSGIKLDAGTGTMYLGADTSIKLDGNTVVSGGATFTTGTGTLTFSGTPKLAPSKAFQFTTGTESIRLPNDSVIASGSWTNSSSTMWGTHLTSGAACGWLMVKIQKSGSGVWESLYAPLFSSNNTSGVWG